MIGLSGLRFVFCVGLSGYRRTATGLYCRILIVIPIILNKILKEDPMNHNYFYRFVNKEYG